MVRYSANAIIAFIMDPKNGFVVDGGVPQCPKGKGCLDAVRNCSYPTGCHMVIRFFKKDLYGYLSLNFTFPLHKHGKGVGDGYVYGNNGALVNLIKREIINPAALVSV